MQQRSQKSSQPKARRILGKQSTYPHPDSVGTPRPTKVAAIQRTIAEPPILMAALPARVVVPALPTRAVAAVAARQDTLNTAIEPPILGAARPARVETARPARAAAMQGAPAVPAESPTFMAMAMVSDNALQFNIDIDLPENSIKRNIEFFLSVLPSVTVAATLLVLVSGMFYYSYSTKISARASELRDIAIITAPAGSKTDIRSVVTRLVYDSQWKPEDVNFFLNTWQHTDATHKAMLTKKYWYKKFLVELRTDIKSVLEREDMTKQDREALIALATNVGVLDSRYSTFR